jgi:glycine dehydrogenase
VFHEHRSETALMRWLRRLADADLALDRTMIPLGSCTMKLNAAAEMEPITWPAFADLHPFAPAADAAGTLELIEDLERWLAELTGYAAVSLQPNAGSQGEFAGLLAIAAYHRSRGESHRDVCLIPASAHGTNAASAVMAGMRVVVVATGRTGDVDLDDLRAKIAEHRAALAALMITYPSTHGVFEGAVREVCDAVHEAGGQVYVDGANLNALVGLARPGAFGGDVSHLNLHKTFCIPHGGGGPGVGPVAVAEHLAPFLPGRGVVGPVSAAPHGSPGVLPDLVGLRAADGLDGLRRATLTAVAAANYVAARLREHYPVLYAGADGHVAHECILDLRAITRDTGVTVDDVAKRLADLRPARPDDVLPGGGHPDGGAHRERGPRRDRPVRRGDDRHPRGDRAGGRGEWPVATTRCAARPHTAASLIDKWDHPYPRDLAGYPTGGTPGVHDRKVWPPVRRIDGAHGDRNLVCSCPPVEAYSS